MTLFEYSVVGYYRAEAPGSKAQVFGLHGVCWAGTRQEIADGITRKLDAEQPERTEVSVEINALPLSYLAASALRRLRISVKYAIKSIWK